LIKNFSLNIEPGARVALVGRSGSGKSTIAKIATGLYPPWSGKILLDNTERDKIPEFVLKNCVAMVDQNIFLFEGSFRENLTLWDKFIGDKDIIQGCRDADIYETIIRRPNGLDGHLNENGTNLSGGQRQCLEIARTLVRNPALLILDEASNALDPVREHKIDINIRQRGCSCLIVAHRLSTIRDADEIIVLDQGKVVQRGTHDQLMEQGGLYKTLIVTETQ
jgi:ABC-type bacteriocin/lantibiotic exporter with double-glycine peptidase domain